MSVETTCVGGAAADTNSTTCLSKNKNAFYDSVAKKCHCCNIDGTAFLDKTVTPFVCKPCTAATPAIAAALGIVPCGANSFCKGPTINRAAVCVENTTTKTWHAVCPTDKTNVACGGECNSACGYSEFFAFSLCQINTSTGLYQCAFSWSQWKSWATYAFFFLVIILLIILGLWIVNASAVAGTSQVTFSETGTELRPMVAKAVPATTVVTGGAGAFPVPVATAVGMQAPQVVYA